MAWHAARTYSGDPSTPRDARRFCTEQLSTAPLGASQLIDAAELIVSELVTNAVNARSTDITLGLTLDDSRLRITVSDDASGTPAPRYPGAEDEHGRGLFIVSNLAPAWGFDALTDRKQVWAELPLPADPS